MKKLSFEEALDRIRRRDRRYREEAYEFIREALDFTIKWLAKPVEGPARHVSGQELLAGIRTYALQEYGPMALRVLRYWGLHGCEDFGELVFNLVEEGILGRTEEDSREDFSGGFDFEAAFTEPFLPAEGRGNLRENLPKQADRPE